jgi:hypothetical protein
MWTGPLPYNLITKIRRPSKVNLNIEKIWIYRRAPTYVDPDLRKKKTSYATTTTPTPASASIEYDSDSSIDY